MNKLQPLAPVQAYSWTGIFDIVKEHKKTLIFANIIAIFAVVISVPVPLLMPLLVDEVLLDKPGKITELLSMVFPQAWLTPISIIVIIMLLSMLLRLGSLLLSVLQMQSRWIGARVNLLNVRNQRLAQRINLHLALGGSFEAQ